MIMNEFFKDKEDYKTMPMMRGNCKRLKERRVENGNQLF